MQLINDVFVIENLIVLQEASVGKNMKIRGVFQRADEANNNKRIYSRKILTREMDRLAESIVGRSLMGELDHPTYENVKLSNVSHIVTNLNMKGNEMVGEAEILDTPAGIVARKLIEGGVRVGISSRGMGTLTEGVGGLKYVNEDYKLVTFDLVADPSTRGAFPGLTESTEITQIVESTIKQVMPERVFITLLKNKLSEIKETPARRIPAKLPGRTEKITKGKHGAPMHGTGKKGAAVVRYKEMWGTKGALKKIKKHTAGPKGKLPEAVLPAKPNMNKLFGEKLVAKFKEKKAQAISAKSREDKATAARKKVKESSVEKGSSKIGAKPIFVKKDGKWKLHKDITPEKTGIKPTKSFARKEAIKKAVKEGFFNRGPGDVKPHQKAYTVGRKLAHRTLETEPGSGARKKAEATAKARRDKAKKGSGGRSASKGYAEVMGDAGQSHKALAHKKNKK